MLKLFPMLLIIFMLYSSNSYSQETYSNNKIGISAAIQNDQFEIQLPIRTSSYFLIAPSISFISIGDDAKDFQLGLSNRIYISPKKVSTYAGARIGVLFNIPKNADSVIDYTFGISGGAEYYFDKNFSIGIEGQLNVSKSDDKSVRFASPGEFIINTATVILATIYF
ncbi:MAG: hypothetical protein JXR46_16310 [Calditrichaceae bacterium]|nr:hypothetical protein [Calditrichaceae bacterium]MBN2710609.1 hypothetical protein [Calditrichaceae bacterium]RQV96789.1 MAG: hypothetical protein EH224_03435 [Calditrichota bacterium]